MHPFDTDLVARCRRDDAHRAAASWRTHHPTEINPPAGPVRAAVGRGLVALGTRLQVSRPSTRRGLHGRTA